MRDICGEASCFIHRWLDRHLFVRMYFMTSFFFKENRKKKTPKTPHHLTDVYEKMRNQAVETESKQGPRNYNTETTARLKDLMVMMLDKNLQVLAEYDINPHHEIEVYIGGRLFNITELLQHHPDFEHMAFDEEQADQYKKIVSQYDTSNMGLLDESKFKALATETGEKIAIFLYTADLYKEIQAFLRHPTMEESERNKFIDEMQALKTSNKLNEYVTRILLCTGMASFGLNTLNSSPKVQDSTVEAGRLLIIRNEATNSVINNKREEMIREAKTSRLTGFVSTSLNDTFEVDSKQKTVIIFRDEGHGKIIHKISNAENEEEILFHPGTEVKFIAMQKEGDTTFFLADTVRGVDLEYLDQFTAEKREQNNLRRLYCNLKPLSEKNYQLSSLCKKLYALIAPESAMDEKNEGRNFRLRQVDLLDIVNDTRDLLHNSEKISVEERQVLQYIQKNILSMQNETIFKNLLPHVEYVYETFLKKPYAINPKDSEHLAKFGETEIPRPNHSLAHVVRTVSYLPNLVMFLSKHGNAQVRKFCNDMSEKNMELMQIAMLFFVSGRQSEDSVKDNPENYKIFMQSRVENFAKYVAELNHARMGAFSFSADEIKNFKYILSGAGDPEFPAQINRDETISDEIKLFLVSVTILLEQAHNLDLLRCFSLESYKLATNRVMEAVEGGAGNVNAREDLELLRAIAYRRILDTGDITRFGWSPDGPISTPKETHSYRGNDFIEASTDPVGCMKKASLLSEDFLLPNIANKIITIPPMTEDIAKNIQKEFDLLVAKKKFYPPPELNEYTINIIHYIKVAYPAKKMPDHAIQVLYSIIKNCNDKVKDICGIEFMAKIVMDPGSDSQLYYVVEIIARLIDKNLTPAHPGNKNFLDLMHAIYERGGGNFVCIFCETLSLMQESTLNSIITRITNTEPVKGKAYKNLIKELCDVLQQNLMPDSEKKQKIINIMEKLSPAVVEEKLISSPTMSRPRM